MLKVEVHGHIVLPATFGAAGKYGPEVVPGEDGWTKIRIGPYNASFQGTDPRERPEYTDPNFRLGQMDAGGIDKMVVTISPLWYLYWAEPEIAVPFASLNNDLLAQYCAADPNRLYFAATLPMQDIQAALSELKRVAELGARAINIGTDDFGAGNLDDELYWPLYEAAVERNLPIFLHPYPIPMADGRPDKYNQSWVVGYIYQETTAFTHMTLGGVFDDFPDLRVYITHGGGFVPYHLGRIDAARTMKQPGVRAKRPVREYLEENFFFDIHLQDVAARKFVIDVMGADRLVVGSNVGGWDSANGFALLDELGLPSDDYEKIAGLNAMKLLGLS